jgi:DNA-binding response OmpR family regulator
MEEPTSVMILGRSRSINSNLQSDLRVLGFQPLLGRYPDVDTDDIIQTSPGIILLDLTIYDHDALSVCELLSREGILPPEIALVALVTENAMGKIPLDYKFADIIRFPYDIAELGFRLRRVMHLYHQESTRDTIRIGNLSISPSRYEVKVDGQPVVLRLKEYELLKYLVTHHDCVSTRKALLTSIWGDNVVSDSRTVDVHIRRVRAKIGDLDSTYIKTVRGVGYIFRFEGE